MIIFTLVCILCVAANRFLLGKLFNPVTVFVTIWYLLVLLYKLQWSAYLVPLDNKVYVILDAMVLSFTVLFVVGRMFVLHGRNNMSYAVLGKRQIHQAFFLWFAFSIVEIAYSRGIPLLWTVTGSGKTYFDFGIPSLHGFLNGFAQVIVCLAFYYLLTHKKTLDMQLIIAVVLIYFVLIISRQVIMVSVIEMSVIYILVKRRVNYIGLVLAGIATILIFGLIGNARTGYDTFLEVSKLDVHFPSFLSGFLWVYMYLVMTLANVNNLVLAPELHIHPMTVFSELVPSVISNTFTPSSVISDDREYMGTLLVTRNYNVSGFFRDYYAWTGIGGVMLIAAVYGLIGGITYRLWCQTPSERNVILYAISICIIGLSFFFDMMTYLPVVVQYFIVLFMFRGKHTNTTCESSL